MSTPAKKIFITTKTQETVLDLLNSNPQTKNKVQTILDSGAVWHNKKRVLNHAHIIPKKDTIIVYTTDKQGQKYELDPSRVVHETEDFIIINKHHHHQECHHSSEVEG